ncbi:alanine:cation symporter family protein [Pelagibius litoralis]|uniref:Alanine:cation symporter family protein n=1 Tax=Pelagibius litoralis TaxID=374515 RepID=A0A967C1H5_9PROT|nr:alanine/glycine:cation symporter family protein [Pelagibius litoralis]NIA67111.1 alanine:cation symporter family protein [Pelagibius litoralis]
MKKLLAAFLTALLWAPASWAQDSTEMAISLDEQINQAISPVTDVIAGVIFYSVPVNDEIAIPVIVVWLVVAALFATIYFNFISVRAFGHAVELVKGDYSDPKDAGEVSHFQALATALSGTVGLGNIAGVAIAVSIGGPGATFWMILAGFLGMSLKFAECTLGVKYRNEYADGSVSGGPMYYLSKGLAEKGMGGLGKVLAVFFAICCIAGSLGGGNMFQANQSFQQFVNVTGGADSFMADKGWLFGLIVAALVGVVIIGGIQSIAKVTEKVVPFMAVIYCSAALIIIVMNIDQVPSAIGAIIGGAFNPEGVAGGAIGALIQGFRRAAFSNEAGIGSASIAHSAVRTKEPITEGLVALHEPFIDTVVICTMTALVIVITGTYTAGGGMSGVELTSLAFESAFSWFPYILAVAVILFAFSTMLSWSYYGAKCWTYLFGESRSMDLLFKLIFCIFVVIGASMNLGPVIDFSDSAIFAMSIANIIGLYILFPVVKQELTSYWSRLKSGEIKKYAASESGA